MVKLEIKSNKRNIQVKPLLNNKIPYNILDSKSNRLSLKFNREGILVIRKPILMPYDKMEMFIDKNIDWVKDMSGVDIVCPLLHKFKMEV